MPDCRPREADAPAAPWRIGSTVADPAAFGCSLCAARRTGTAVRGVRFAARWERVCIRRRPTPQNFAPAAFASTPDSAGSPLVAACPAAGERGLRLLLTTTVRTPPGQ